MDVAYFEALHLPGKTQENHTKPQWSWTVLRLRFEPGTVWIHGWSTTFNHCFEWCHIPKELPSSHNTWHTERHTWGEAGDTDPCRTHTKWCSVWCVGGRWNHHCHSVCCTFLSSSEPNVCVHWIYLLIQSVWCHRLRWTLWQCLELYHFSADKTINYYHVVQIPVKISWGNFTIWFIVQCDHNVINLCYVSSQPPVFYFVLTTIGKYHCLRSLRHSS